MTRKKKEQCICEIWKKLIPIRNTNIFKHSYRYYLASEGVQSPMNASSDADLWDFAEHLYEKPEQFTKLISKYENNQN